MIAEAPRQREHVGPRLGDDAVPHEREHALGAGTDDDRDTEHRVDARAPAPLERGAGRRLLRVGHEVRLQMLDDAVEPDELARHDAGSLDEELRGRLAGEHDELVAVDRQDLRGVGVEGAARLGADAAGTSSGAASAKSGASCATRSSDSRRCCSSA